MNKYLVKLSEISQKPERLIIGLMSGTSLDGLDIVLCRITGDGENARIEVLEFLTHEYSSKLRKQLRNVQSNENTPTRELTFLHSELGLWYGSKINEAIKLWNLSPDKIDLIASHGQTIYHAPAESSDELSATLQIVDGDHIAQKCGIITVSDFRQKHTAVGGQGAPLAGIFDEILFRDEKKNRMLLNLGGIANFTWLPSKESGKKVITGDTGPANTLINEAMQKYYDQPFDKDGKVASNGNVHSGFVKYVLLDPYFSKSFPKSTGQEEFRLSYIESLMQGHGILLSHDDLIASLTAITSHSISRAADEITGDQHFECYVSGGGVHNKSLMNDLKNQISQADFISFEKLGIPSDAKEATMMVYFANELIAGEGFIIPRVTDKKVHLGKISLPD
ncbi:MAG: anhydro-N-acetylmuramic acid kinase [Balneolaceae bacterium]